VAAVGSPASERDHTGADSGIGRAVATVAGHRVAVSNPRLLEREGAPLAGLAARREELAATGRTTVLVAVDGRPAGLIALADAPRPTAPAAIQALHDLGVEVVMLTGDNRATARRIADQLGIDTVIAEVLPGDMAAQIAAVGLASLSVTAPGGWTRGTG
jgi:P-type Cu2+ transporter